MIKYKTTISYRLYLSENILMWVMYTLKCFTCYYPFVTMMIRFNTDGPERSTTLQNHTTTDFYRLEKEVKDLQIKYAKGFFFIFNFLLRDECTQLLYKSLES